MSQYLLLLSFRPFIIYIKNLRILQYIPPKHKQQTQKKKDGFPL